MRALRENNSFSLTIHGSSFSIDDSQRRHRLIAKIDPDNQKKKSLDVRTLCAHNVRTSTVMKYL